MVSVDVSNCLRFLYSTIMSTDCKEIVISFQQVYYALLHRTASTLLGSITLTPSDSIFFVDTCPKLLKVSLEYNHDIKVARSLLRSIITSL